MSSYTLTQKLLLAAAVVWTVGVLALLAFLPGGMLS
jgi:hypothetical protein